MNHISLYITPSDQELNPNTKPLRIFHGETLLQETTHYDVNMTPSPVMPPPRKIYWDENGVAVRQIVAFDTEAARVAGFEEHPHKISNDFGMRVFKFQMDLMTGHAIMEVDKIPELLPEFMRQYTSAFKFHDETHATTT